MNKKILIGLAVAIVVIAIAGLFFPKGRTVVQQVQTALGATSSLDGVDNPFVTIGGVKQWISNVPLNATSSAVISVQNPLAATSTVAFSCESTNVGIAQANNLFFGTTTLASRYATTTATSWNQGFAMGTGQWSYQFTKNVATSTNSTLGATTNVLEGANPDGASNYILGPTEVFFGIIATSTPGTFVTYDVGSCNIVIQKI